MINKYLSTLNHSKFASNFHNRRLPVSVFTRTSRMIQIRTDILWLEEFLSFMAQMWHWKSSSSLNVSTPNCNPERALHFELKLWKFVRARMCVYVCDYAVHFRKFWKTVICYLDCKFPSSLTFLFTVYKEYTWVIPLWFILGLCNNTVWGQPFTTYLP